MTTDTEALRQAFEDYINPEGDVALHWQPAGYYAGSGLQGSWIDFQSGYWAGHAAAKAETADVGEPVAMVQCHGNAAHPLYTAAQLAAAVAAERGKCAGIVNELRMECARRNMPESATMLWHAEDAIRAGAKETGNG